MTTYRKVQFLPIQQLMNAAKNPKQKARGKEEATWPLYLAAFIFLIGVYLVFSALGSGSREVEEVVNPRQAEIEREQKIEYYKRQLGEKLNRSRTLAEHQMLKESQQPSSNYHQEAGYRQSVEGLPLDYEKKTYAPRDPSKLAEAYLPDQRVAYDLQEEQNAEFWEEEAQRKFLREYLLNARAQGYDLAIDSNYNVIVKRSPKKMAQNRMPQNTVEPTATIRLRFKAPFFVPPPYCH